MSAQFAGSSRLLHWLMALLILSMLFIGVAMVGSLGSYGALVALHKPVGVAIFVLTVIRFINRQRKPPPEWPATMSAGERVIASLSERVMYGLMFVLPLVGWAMLSAAPYPIVLWGGVHLPSILAPHPGRYSALRTLHGVLAYAFFGIILAHLTAVLFHTLVLRDGLLARMAPWKSKG